MEILIIVAFLLLYTIGIYFWNKHLTWRLNSKLSKRIKYIHYMTLFVALSVAFTNQYGLGLRGLWTTRTFVIIALLIGIFFNFITDQSILNKTEKVYFKLFSFLPTVTGVILCIPFLGALIVFSLLGRLIEPVTNIYFEDQSLRIQGTFHGTFRPKSIDIFEKKYFYEKYLDVPKFYCEDNDSIAVHYDKDSTRIFIYEQAIGDSKPKIISIDKVN